MADQETITKSLSVAVKNTNNYTEENPAKTQYIKIPNPKDNLTEEQVKNAIQTGFNSQLYIDDKGEVYASDSKIITAYTEISSVISVDIGVE